MKILYLAFILAIVSTKFVVYRPSALKTIVGNEQGVIESDIANYGVVPYGHSIVGEFYIDPDNLDGCGRYSHLNIGDKKKSMIFGAVRGNCTYVTKSRNAEYAGAQMMVVIDNRLEDDLESLVLQDDGTGKDIVIPTVMISRSQGQSLLKFVEDNPNEQIQLLYHFDTNAEDDRVEYDIWMSSSDSVGLNFIKDFKQYHELLGANAWLTPRYFHWKCFGCSENLLTSNCVSSGKYCGMHGNDD